MLGKGHAVLLRRAVLKTFVNFHGNELNNNKVTVPGKGYAVLLRSAVLKTFVNFHGNEVNSRFK